MDDRSEFILSKSREALSDYRVYFKGKLQNWETYVSVEHNLKYYVSLNNQPNIHENLSDLSVDLGILKGILHNLEVEYDQAKKEFYPLQLQYAYAQRNRSMMLRDLYVIYGTQTRIPVDIREWIKWILLDEHLDDILEIADAREEELKKQATEEGYRLAEPIIKPEKPELLDLGNNLDLVQERCSMFDGEFADLTKKANVNLIAYERIPQMCQSIKELMSILESRFPSTLDDDINRKKQRVGPKDIEVGGIAK